MKATATAIMAMIISAASALSVVELGTGDTKSTIRTPTEVVMVYGESESGNGFVDVFRRVDLSYTTNYVEKLVFTNGWIHSVGTNPVPIIATNYLTKPVKVEITKDFPVACSTLTNGLMSVSSTAFLAPGDLLVKTGAVCRVQVFCK